jgi:hypothetical protein
MFRGTSTVDELLDEQADVDRQLRHQRRLRVIRRITLGVLALIVLAAVVGLFGRRSRTVRATGHGYTIEVRYPSIVRDGPPASVTITVRHPSGFDGPVELEVDSAYLSAFEQPEVSPQPDSEQSAADDVVWSFSPPDGTTLVVQLEGQLSSKAQFAHHGRVSVRDQGQTAAEVAFTTWVWP